MVKQRVLLLGAHGETGGDILDGLLEDGSYDVSALVQPSSSTKPAVRALAARNIPIVIGNLSGDVDELAKALQGFDTLISAINAKHILDQIPLVDAAAKAGVKRFVPCDFSSVIPPGVMTLRDEKEMVHQQIWLKHLPYTFIDVGYWHQISWFRTPSGKLDYALVLDRPEIFGTGNVKTLLGDKRDTGKWIARIIKDPRTLNKKVVAWSDEISQNSIVALIESKTGEKVHVDTVSEAELQSTIAAAEQTLKSDPTDMRAWMGRTGGQYNNSKWIREDGTLANAKYLGYLDARELFPDFKPITFEAFLDELVAGTLKKPYEESVFTPLLGVKGKEEEERVTPRTE